MADPVRRLRSLDDVRTRDLWSRIEGHAAGSEPIEPIPARTSLGRRAATIAVAFAVFSAGGLFLVSQFDGGDLGPPRSDDPVVPMPTAGELAVTCAEGGTVVEGDPVELQADGVHLSVRNDADAGFLYMRDPENVGQSIGLELGGPSSRSVVLASMEVGTWVAGCFSGSFNTHDVPLSAYSPPFQIVDPHGFADDLRDAAECGDSLPDPMATAAAEAPLAGPLEGWLTVQAWDHDTGEARAFFVRADGTQVEPIEADRGPIDELEVSPDGSKIALVIRDDADGDPTTYYASREDSEIYVMDRDGSDLTRLTDNQASDDIVHWTPDGRLSFRSNRDGDLGLFAMDADGSNVLPLIDLKTADSHDWEAGSSRLALVGEDGRDRGDGCLGNGHELYVANADGSGLTALTEDELYEQAPAWSPDGSTIAFTASVQSDYAWEIFLVNADGSGLRRITDYDGYDQDPVWSPDGTLIAFTSDRFLGPDRHGESQGGLPYVMNADGSGVRPLVDPDDLGIGRPWDIYVTDWRP